MKTTVKLLKGDYVKKNGTVPLYLYIYINGEKDKLPLNLDWQKDFVSEDENKVLPRNRGDKDANDYNIIITSEIGKINDIFKMYRLAERHLTITELKREYLEYEKRNDFCTYMEKKIKERFYRKKIAASTKKSQTTALNWLKAFKNPITYNELTKKNIEKFESWLQQQENRHLSRPAKLNKNTVANILKYIKAYINLAIKDNIPIENPFAKADVSTGYNQGMIDHLQPSDVARLMDIYDKENLPIGEKLTLCRFLIACVLSLRISDILKIDNEKLESYRAARRLAFHPVKQRKTDKLKTIYLPIDDVALSYLEDLIMLKKRALDENLVVSEAYGRKVLKKIAHRYKIKVASFHTGRHSFATNFLRAGGSVQNLQHILGHSNIKTTMNYVHIVEDDKDEEMLKLTNFYTQFRQ